jgi:hypothetical protein
MSFPFPPEPHTREGRLRRVGFELEYTGVPTDAVAEALIELFGGRLEAESRFRQRVVDTRLGEFAIELDFAALRDARYREFLIEHGVRPEDVPLLDRLEALAEQVAVFVAAPYEVITPPLPLDRLDEVERVRDVLRARGAAGTRTALRYAFGLHLNVEAPSLEGPVLLAFLRAFLALYDWLVRAEDVDPSRRLFPFIEPFPDEYRARVLAPGYAPDLDGLIADYLAANPTRNRPLDLVPLFTAARGDAVRRAIKEADLVRPRPAFHYRLPDCLVDDPAWTLAAPWGRWLEVERLAADPRRLSAVCAAWHACEPTAERRAGAAWADRVGAWLAGAEPWPGR